MVCILIFRGVFQVNLKKDLSGVHFRKFKGNLKISTFDIHRQNLTDSLVNDLMYAFNPVFRRKMFTQLLLLLAL